MIALANHEDCPVEVSLSSRARRSIAAIKINFSSQSPFRSVEVPPVLTITSVSG
jgi:hypothetical protein